MPNATDDFLLIVLKSVAAAITITSDDTLYVGTGEEFVVTFNYIGGIGPASTAFEVAWYNSSGDRNSMTNALTTGLVPGNDRFTPSRPRPGGNLTTGQLDARAPNLPGGTSRKDIYARLTIVQANLENPG